MKPALDFYEVVSILPCDEVPSWLWNTQAVVLGRAEGDNGVWEYAVQAFADNNHCWQLEEKRLRSEGRKMTRDELYSGESTIVRIDPATGNGSTEK